MIVKINTYLNNNLTLKNKMSVPFKRNSDLKLRAERLTIAA